MQIMPMVVRFARFLRCGLCGRLLQVWLVGEESGAAADPENPEWYAAEAEERLPPAVGEKVVLFEHEVIDRLGPMHTH
ncbi:MAG: hypothetical protein HY720_15485 [Planctomycetes bacterium]|nr:hypothetical protein [Planctomycetota bacterium]